MGKLILSTLTRQLRHPPEDTRTKARYFTGIKGVAGISEYKIISTEMLKNSIKGVFRLAGG
jgi:hypothetical protein